MSNVTNAMIKNFFDVKKPLVKVPAITKSENRVYEAGACPTSSAYVPKFKLDKKPGHRRQAWYTDFNPELAEEQVRQEQVESDLMRLELNDGPAAAAAAEIPETDADHMYQHYDYNHQYDQKLPITQFQELIVNTIESNAVTVIQGSTGSGKTTQVPQYILDNYIRQRRYCNIIVTQPRRIAAISIAKRVSKERGWQTGGVVGYQVGRDKLISEDTRINYVTTGVLLQKLIATKSMNSYTHVILDEVHERDQESDFCMLVVRKLLRTVSRHVKVVLMSATLNSNLFAQYFAVPIHNVLEPAPCVSVEGNIYPVAEYYLEDLAPSIQSNFPILRPEEPGIDADGYTFAALLVKGLDRRESEQNNKRRVSKGTVLIFLPGIREIEEMNIALADICGKHLEIIPLHSQITTEEQQKVFLSATDPDFRKVILSTNIAESSITVPDIKYVIDFCLTKCLVCDQDTNYQSLKLQWASKANCTQRRGRAGRVSRGECFRMVSKGFYKSYLPEYGIPEMRRCPLDQLVLQVKLLDLGEPRAILSLALEPPDLDDIEKSVFMLKEVGAITVLKNGILNPFDGDLTFLGKVLGRLPLDIRLGKLIVLGNVFGVLEECLVIAASLSLKSFFARPYRQDIEAYRWKMSRDSFNFSDCIASLLAYQEWTRRKASRDFDGMSENQWGKKTFIQIKRIREVEVLVNELEERVKHFGLRTRGPIHRKNITSQEHKHDILILKLVIAGAFYPHYFLSGEIDEAEAAKTMSGHDPFTTIMVRGMPPHGNLYRSSLARMFRTCGQGRALHFEGTRCFIEFETPSRLQQFNHHPVYPAVYMALKMRELRIPLTIYMSQKDTEAVNLEMREMFMDRSGNRLKTERLQSFFTSSTEGALVGQPQQVELPRYGYLEIFTTEVIDGGHFWAQLAEHQQALASLMDRINVHGGKNFFPMPEHVSRGDLCLAIYSEDHLYYRARVERIINRTEIEVFYVDYGNAATVPKNHLRQIPPQFLEVPFQAVECYLAGIRPSFNITSSGIWTKESRDFFIKLTSTVKLVAKIYSNLQNVLHIDLYDTSTAEDVHINEMMVMEGHGEYREETYYSRMAHQQGEAERMINESGGKSKEDKEKEAEACGWKESEPARLHPRDDGVTKVSLVGPFNPYEMTWMNITNIGHLKPAMVERESVNSICLDTEPQDKHPRLLVASTVSVNPSGNMVIARGTTLMPNIHGLLAFVGLLFAPFAEMRTDSDMRQYTGALVGLGPEQQTGEAILPDHDIEIVFDVHFDNEDLVLINTTRTAINMMMDPSSGLGTGGQHRIQSAARDKLINLLFKRKREDRKPVLFKKPYRWNQIPPEHVLEPNQPQYDESLEDRPVYSLHRGVAISGQSLIEEGPSERVLQLRESVKKLRELAGRSSEFFTSEVVCELCNVICRHPRGVTSHLETRIHREEEKLIFED